MRYSPALDGLRAVAVIAALGFAATLKSSTDDWLPAIGHAGGGLAGETYTNSIDALDKNAKHYSIFEIDLNWTSDGELVCIHDWQSWATPSSGHPPTLEEFERLVSENSTYTNCTASTLANWLGENPTKRVMLDIKTDNVRGLELFADRYPEAQSQIIAEIYQPEQYEAVQELGYESILWALYQYDGNHGDVIRHAQEIELFAVGMPKRDARAGLARALDKVGVQTYVHTVNKMPEARYFRSLGIDGVCTDWLYRD